MTTCGQVATGVGQAVEVVLTLAAGGDDAAVSQQSQVMADGGLALAELGAQGTDVSLAIGQDQDDLEPGGIADVLEQDRRAAGDVKPLFGPAGPWVWRRTTSGRS